MKVGLRGKLELKFSERIAHAARHLLAPGKEHYRGIRQGLAFVLALDNLSHQHQVSRSFFALEADIDGVVACLKQQMAARLASRARAGGVGISQAVILKSCPYTLESRHWTWPPCRNRGGYRYPNMVGDIIGRQTGASTSKASKPLLGRVALETTLLQMDLHVAVLRWRNQISDIVGPFCNIEMTNHVLTCLSFLGEGCL